MKLSDVHLQLLNIWSQPNPKWLPQLTDFSPTKTGCSSVAFIDIKLKSDVVAQHHPLHIVTCCAIFVFNTLASTLFVCKQKYSEPPGKF